MTDSSKISKKRKTCSTLTSIAEIGGHKYSTSYTDTLYRLGISDVDGAGIVPSVLGDAEVSKYFPEPKDLPLLSGFMKSWFEKFQPNEASLVNFLCECLFPLNVSTSDQNNITLLHEFSGPFKSHNILELMRGDEGIRYPIVKRDPLQKESTSLQTPAEEDLRSRSDFVFAASTDWAGGKFSYDILVSDVPCLSNNRLTCAVAIVAEVKATFSQTSVAAAKNQWSSLAYLQMMERISISREAPYVGDKNICQYGYGICGLRIVIWRMGLKWNRSKGRPSEVLKNYFTFPVERVDAFNLQIQDQLEEFVDTHKKILHWWVNGYLPSYIKDITSIQALHPKNPHSWRRTWREAVDTCGCLVSHLSVFLTDIRT